MPGTFLPLLEIDVTGATLGLSTAPVAASGIFFEPLVEDFGGLTRSIPLRPGLPTFGSITVRGSNRALNFSQWLAQYEFLNRTVRYKIADADAAYSAAATHFTGKIIAKPSISNGLCTIQMRETSGDYWKREAYGRIKASDFPNLPENLLTAQANIIHGKVSSVDKTDQGFVPCQLVDTVEHIYLVACHLCKSIDDVYAPTQFASATYAVIEIEMPDGSLWTGLKFDQDVEDTDFPDQFSVAVDASGLYDNATEFSWGTGDEHLFTNPAELFKAYNTLFVGYVTGDFDATAYTAAVNAKATAGHFLGGVLNTPDQFHDANIAQLLQDGAMDCFFTKTGKIYLQDYKVETADGTEPILDHEFYIQEGSFSIDWNRDVINEIQGHYDYDAVGESFKQEPLFDNLLSQAALDDQVLSEELEMRLVDDKVTAENAIKTRLYYSDEGRPIVRFQLSMPQTPAGVELAQRIKVTHFEGLSATKVGWTAKLFKVLALDYENNGTPKIGVTALGLTAESTTYLPSAIPANAATIIIDETDEGYIVVGWTLVGGADDPAFFDVWYKRAEDELPLARNAGRVAVGAPNYVFEAFYDESGTLDLFLVPVSANGVERTLDWIIDTTKDTTLAEAVDLEEPAIDVASIADIAVDDKVLCGREINKVLSKAGSTLTMYATGGVRDTYEGRARATHANGAAVGTIKPTVTWGQDTARTKITAISTLDLDSFPSKMILTWDALTNPDDLLMFRTAEVWYSLTNDYATATLYYAGPILGQTWTVAVGLDRDTTYYFWVTHMNIYGVRSVESNVVSGQITGATAIIGDYEFKSEAFTIDDTNIVDYVDLSGEAVFIVDVRFGGNSQAAGIGYNTSVVLGVTRVTFTFDITPPPGETHIIEIVFIEAA